MKFLNLEVSGHGLSQFSGKHRTVFIPRDDIQSIQIRFGSNAERPILQFIVGTALCALGEMGIVVILNGGGRGLSWGLGFMVFGGFGAWMLYEIIHKSHYLMVTTRNDPRKLIIRGACSQAGFDQFSAFAAGLSYHFGSVDGALAPPSGRSLKPNKGQ